MLISNSNIDKFLPECESVIGSFVKSALDNPYNIAIYTNQKSISYQDLLIESCSVANAICSLNNKSPFVAVLGYRSTGVYASILGCLLAGKAYVPLNPKFPESRTLKMIEKAHSEIIIICQESKRFRKLICSHFPHAEILDFELVPHNHNIDNFPTRTDDHLSYLLFTSGTTGESKGIVIKDKNLNSYLRYTRKRYLPTPKDRFSQTFDLTFDLSVHDIFLALGSGATLCVVPGDMLMAPAKFINDQNITFWFSVPSTAMFMKRVRMLNPGSFPTIRYSLFCGEALPVREALAWQEAAPNSIVENLYGPTEGTIAITNYRIDANKKEYLNSLKTVPIGEIYPNHMKRVVGSDGRRVAKGVNGELYVSGDQVCSGYWKDEKLTRESFVRFCDSNSVWYRTGDIVYETDDGLLHYVDRIDNQIKIAGYRVELQEIEALLRNTFNDASFVAVALQSAPEAFRELYVAVETDNFDDDLYHLNCTKHLPYYMIPKRFIKIDRVPLNANGKTDRNKVAFMLERIIRNG
jgi:amino acid adenylation domain-containing protein